MVYWPLGNSGKAHQVLEDVLAELRGILGCLGILGFRADGAAERFGRPPITLVIEIAKPSNHNGLRQNLNPGN